MEANSEGGVWTTLSTIFRANGSTRLSCLPKSIRELILLAYRPFSFFLFDQKLLLTDHFLSFFLIKSFRPALLKA
jgi:hypothetical protein